MRITTLILLVLCAALCFGGSFNCKADQNSDQFTHHP